MRAQLERGFSIPSFLIRPASVVRLMPRMRANQALTEKARTLVAEAKYACDKAGVACEYEGGHSANVCGKVSFLVEKTDKGVRVGEGPPRDRGGDLSGHTLMASVSKVAYAYTDKHFGPPEEIGNKGGSLSNRLRAALSA